jgi:hypothetical protein
MYPSSPQHTIIEEKSSYLISNGSVNGGSHAINNNTSFGNNKIKKTGDLLLV